MLHLVFRYAFVVLATASTLFGQAGSALTNDDVISMVKAGLAESTIIKAVETSEIAFDTSGRGLIALKQAGVTDKVLAAMLDRRARTSASDGLPTEADRLPNPSQPPPARADAGPGHSTPAPAVNENWPSDLAGMPREPGIYYRRSSAFVALYGKPIIGTKTGGGWKNKITLGVAKVRAKGQLAGKRAQLQISERQPPFYFYMQENQTPEGFSFIRLEEGKNQRRFEVAAAGGASGEFGTGLDVNKVYQVIIERVAPRLYRVTPDRELQDGEYGLLGSFTYAAAGLPGGGERIYDFGLHQAKRE